MKIFICLATVIALTLAEPPSYRQQFQGDRPTYYVAKQVAQQPAAEAPENSPADAPYSPSGWKPEGPKFELPQKQPQQLEPAVPTTQYGAPNKIENQYGAPAASPSPQRQYGGPTRGQKQFVAPQQNYRVPQQQYNPPQQQYNPPQQQYNPPQQQKPAPQPNYGAPPQVHYGVPQFTTTESTTPIDFEESTLIPTATESQAEPVDSVNELNEDGDSNEQQRQSGEYFIALPDGRLQRVQYISSQNIEAMKYFARIRAENVEPLRGPIFAYQPLQRLQFTPAQLQVQPIDQATAPISPAIVTEMRESNARNQKIVKTPVAAPSTASAASSLVSSESPAKLQAQPLAAELPGSPLSGTYTTYMANLQLPVADHRYLITF